MTNTSPHSSQGFNNIVWSAFNMLRGKVAPSVLRGHLLTILFLKYVSDVWQDHYDQYLLQCGDQPNVIMEILRHERFVLPDDSGFNALCQEMHEPGNGERIDRALRAIEDANSNDLRDVFKLISFDSDNLGDKEQRDDILRNLLYLFSGTNADLRPSRASTTDVIGNACEFLFKNAALVSGKGPNEFFTPPEVSQLMALLMDPKEGDEICDPACGSGSLLIKCGNLVRERHSTRRYALYGQEVVESNWALAKLNLYLHGEANWLIECGDTVRNPKLLNANGSLKHFDVLVAKPPFSTEEWGIESAALDPHDRFLRGLPPRTKGDYAFILHMVETMKPVTGRMAVVVANGVLFRGAAEGQIRRRLVEENLLDIVIGLPDKLFYGTDIPAAVLVFRKCKTDNKVLFIDASHDCNLGKRQNTLRPQDLERILMTVRMRQDVAKYAYLASTAEIATNDFNLSIPRYVDSIEEYKDIDMLALQHERELLKTELGALEVNIASCLKELGYE